MREPFCAGEDLPWFDACGEQLLGGRPRVVGEALEVPEGSFVTVLGPSGSGKSTILQMIGGFLQPTAGRILFAGTDMTAVPPNKRPCNTIFQDLGLFPHMTVAENVAYGLKVRGVDPATRRKCTVEMLGIVALEGRDPIGLGRRAHQQPARGKKTRGQHLSHRRLHFA